MRRARLDAPRNSLEGPRGPLGRLTRRPTAAAGARSTPPARCTEAISRPRERAGARSRCQKVRAHARASAGRAPRAACARGPLARGCSPYRPTAERTLRRSDESDSAVANLRRSPPACPGGCAGSAVVLAAGTSPSRSTSASGCTGGSPRVCPAPRSPQKCDVTSTIFTAMRPSSSRAAVARGARPFFGALYR